MYTRYDTYTLQPKEQKAFGVTEVSTLRDENENMIIINVPENGLLAGDRVAARRNPYFDVNKALGVNNRPLTYVLTDDYDAAQAVRLAEAGREREGYRLEGAIGMLSIIASNLPKLKDADAPKLRRYSNALETVSGADAQALNPDKKLAVEHLEQSLQSMKDKGMDVDDEVRSNVLFAAQKYGNRQADLRRQTKVNAERSNRLRSESIADGEAKTNLDRLGATAVSVVADMNSFLQFARKRITKPGVLTVNNAWYRRNSARSWTNMTDAQNGFESLYGYLMEPMSRLAANKTRKRFKEDPVAAIAVFSPKLFALEDVVDLANIGGDYKKLSESLQELVFETEHFLLQQDFAKAIKSAEKYKFLLRYRTLPGQPAPEEWFSGLSGVKTGKEPVELPRHIQDDPYLDLPT